MLFLSQSSTYAFAESCAAEKRAEYEELAEQLYAIDREEALGAKEAYRVVRMYETFAEGDARCVQMNRLLQDMRETIRIYE